MLVTSASPLLSFVIPCLNEARTIATVIQDCHKGGHATAESYEVIVADNGSVDGSQDIARNSGLLWFLWHNAAMELR